MITKKLIVLFLGAILFYSSFLRAITHQVIDLSVFSNIKDQITLSTSSLPHIHYFLLKQPDRLVIDFKNTVCSLPFNQIDLKHTHIHRIRSSHTRERLRIVFDLTAPPQSVTHAVLKKKNAYQWTFNLTFNNQGMPSVVSSTVSAQKSIQLSQVKQKMVVIIDPGHGGKDPGAIGPQGTFEKEVVLSVAKKLETLLKKEKDVQIELTRSSDYFVPLRYRLKLARKSTADLFISIHADAYKNIHAQGASVFALSQHGATNEAARWLAQKENYSELGGVDLKGKSKLLRSVLIDLSQTMTIQESINLGQLLLDQLRRTTALHLAQVEQAPFVVLKSPDIPSILVEIGFISNRQEEKRLKTAVYQDRVAHALAKGIVEYIHRSLNPSVV